MADASELTASWTTETVGKSARSEWLKNAGAFSLLLLATLMLFATSPKSGDFAFSDAPRHALNGAFVMDFFIERPFSDVRKYAESYYIQYPALSILFYPPLLSVVMAGFYAIFGVSHFVAQATVALFQFGLGVAAYLLARRWLPQWQALGSALLLLGAPEVAFWGRQVMLDIPAFAWLAFSLLLFLKYLDTAVPRCLYLSVLLLLCALYTKQTLVYMLAVFVLTLVIRIRREVLRRRECWISGTIIAVALVPLGVLTWKFGQVNVNSVIGMATKDIPPSPLATWTYYIKQLPEQLGWPAFLAACMALLAAPFGKRWRLNHPDTPFLFVWFGIGYAFFSAIALKEPRHDVTILFPASIAAVLFVGRLVGRASPVAANISILILAAATFSYSLAYRPVPFITGYAEAAHWIVDRAPRHSVVLFAGHRDGIFIFDLRADQRRDDVSVLRADKVLLRLAIKRELGVVDRGLSKESILNIFEKYSVHYIVSQPGFWTDLPSMRTLEELLKDTRHFEVAKRIAVTGMPYPVEKEIVIYRNLDRVADEPAPISLELVGIGQNISGNFGVARQISKSRLNQ